MSLPPLRAGLKLSQVVMISVHIREIGRISDQLKITAMNAMFLTRKVGHQAIGFSVVAAELRRFSEKLDEMMIRLGETVAAEVQCVAEYMKLEHAHLLAERTLPLLDNKIHVEQLMRPHQERLAKMNVRQLSLKRLFESRLKQVARHCRMGETLSNSALIEAAYGGQAAQNLKHVAQETHSMTNDILSILDRLKYTSFEGHPIQ